MITTNFRKKQLGYIHQRSKNRTESPIDCWKQNSLVVLVFPLSMHMALQQNQ